MQDPIGEEILRVRKERKISVPELSKILNIPKDRIYKWEKGSVPKYKDRQIIEKWLAGDWKNVPQSATYSHIKAEQDRMSTFERLLIQLIEMQNKILTRQEEELIARVKTIDINLDRTQMGVDTIQLEVSSEREVVLRSLARLEKMKDHETLIREANNIMVKRGDVLSKKGKLH